MIKIESKIQTRVSSAKAAEIVGLTNACLCIMRKQGRGPKFYKFGARYYYNITELHEWIDARAVDPEAEAAA